MEQDKLLQRKNKTLYIMAYLADQVRKIDDELNGQTNNNENKTYYQDKSVEHNTQKYDS